MQGPNKPPPPPPSGGPPPPPGADPQRAQLSHEQAEELERLRAHVRSLQASSEPEAKNELIQLRKFHADRYSRAQRETLGVINNQILALEHQHEKNLKELDEQLAAATKIQAELSRTLQKIAQQKSDANLNPALLRQIERMEQGMGPIKPIGERLAEATAKRDALRLERLRLEEAFTKADRDYKRQREIARRALLPLKTFLDAIPEPEAAKKEAVAEPRSVRQEVINIQPWIESGLIDGIYLENLRRFILKEDQLEGMDEELPVQFLIQKYNEFARKPEFDERVIAAIATGYLYKDDFHKNDLIPLQGTKTEPALTEAWADLLRQLYQQNPTLQQTAAIPLESNTIAAVAQFVEEQTQRANVGPRTTLPSALRERSAPPVIHENVSLRRAEPKSRAERKEEKAPAMRPELDAIERRRAELEIQHQRDNPLGRPVFRGDTQQVLDLNDRLNQSNGRIGQTEAVLLRDLNEQMHRGQLAEEAVVAFRALNAKLLDLSQSGLLKGLDIRPDLNIEELVRTSNKAFEQMQTQVKAETPISILTEKRAAGFLQAVELYKNKEHKAPSIAEMNAWLKAAHISGLEKRQLQQQMKDIQKQKPLGKKPH